MANENLTTLDRAWIKHGLNLVESSLKRQLDAPKTTDNLREAIQKDLKSLRETITKFA